MLTVNSTINIAGQTVPQIIPVVQGDTGRSILFTLADFTIPQGSTATYYVQKPSGEAVYNAATIDGNTVLVELTAQSIIEAGDNYGQVRIENDGEVVTSFDFILLVKPFRGIDATQSTTEMNIFDKAVEQAEEAIDEAKTGALDDIGDAKDAALQEIAQSTGNFADAFSTSTTYAAGDYVIHSGQLYRFTANHAADAWSGSDAEAVTVGEELTDLNAETTSLKEDLTDLATFPVSIDLTEVEYEQGYLSSGGVFTATSGTNSQKTTVAIPLDEGTYKVTVSGVDSSTTVSYVRAIAVYDSDDVCTKYMQESNMTTFTVGEGDAYVRINTKYTSVTTYMLEEQNVSIALNDDVDIPASTINKIVNPTPTTLDVSSVSYERGYLASNGVFTATSGSNQQKTTVAIPLDAGDYVVSFDGTITNDNVSSGVYRTRAVAVYDSSDVCTYYYLTETANTDIYFTVKETDSYVRINTQYATENVYALKSIIPNKPNYLPYRRPIIAFIFDGEYNCNDEFKALFDEFGKKCGFALQYNTTFANTSLETYQSWEQNGFEILAHSSEAVGTQSSATDDEIAQIVRKSYFKMVENGFNVHGFVAYQGNTKDIAIQTAQKWFEYGATQENHSGSYTETYPDLVDPVLYFGTDSPYHLWRYSMQTSTLAQMKSAVDSCYSNNGLVLFYGHANSSALNNMTVDNVRELLTYIMGYGIPIMTPYDAIRDYYSIRYQDVVSE